MSHSHCDLREELYTRLTDQEYNCAREELNDAIYWCERGNDERTYNALICAADVLARAGEAHAASVVRDYARFF